ncbi:HepT-like ribonuclease domain-containing protein [Runella defluvii]|uniref:HepT-like ribonuclease domain-containing protein n=1 Tax=Runella defluvii TaxID=370973 RepID=UPI001619ADC3
MTDSRYAPKIAWHGVISFRNRLIHGYFGVDYEILWYIIQNDLQELEEQLSTF